MYIVLCAIPLWILAEEKPPLSYIALLFFLFGMYQIIIIASLSQQIIDSFFPPVTLIETKTKPFDRILYYFSSAFFFIGLVFLLFELQQLDNTIGGTNLFWKAGFIGIAVAIVITIILKKTTPSVYFESKRRYTVHFGLFIGCFLWSASAASFINHFYAESEISTKEFVLKRKSTGGKRNASHWLFLQTKPSSEERFEVTESFFETVEERQTILLNIQKGKLGYDVIVGFRKKETH
ncbi:hypothetical protein [Flavobacterium sp.]|uniref:hypothetical protein n=1 Tax=Flavobacterium sp. TaxID=239 RepID=UPI00391B0654